MCIEDDYNVACALLKPSISTRKDFTGKPPQDAPDSMEPQKSPHNNLIYWKLISQKSKFETHTWNFIARVIMLRLALEHKLHTLLQLYLVDIPLHLVDLLDVEFSPCFSNKFVLLEGVVHNNLLVLFQIEVLLTVEELLLLLRKFYWKNLRFTFDLYFFFLRKFRIFIYLSRKFISIHRR